MDINQLPVAIEERLSLARSIAPGMHSQTGTELRSFKRKIMLHEKENGADHSSMVALLQTKEQKGIQVYYLALMFVASSEVAAKIETQLRGAAERAIAELQHMKIARDDAITERGAGRTQK